MSNGTPSTSSSDNSLRAPKGLVEHTSYAFGHSGKDANLVEKVGHLMTWHVSELPKKAWTALHNPKVLTVLLTSAAMLTVALVFYPISTALLIKQVCVFLSFYLKWETIRFIAFLLTELAVFGYGTRAMGRFTNDSVYQSAFSNQNQDNQ